MLSARTNFLIKGKSGRLASTLSAASILLVLTAFGVAIYAAITSGNYQSMLSHQSLTPFVTIAYAVIGALVAARHQRNPIGWIFIAVAVLYALTAFAAAILVYGVSSPLAELSTWLDNWLWIPAVLLPTTFVLLYFPDGHPPSPRWRFVAWSAATGLMLSILVVMLHPGPLSTWGNESNPYGIPAAAPVLNILADIGTGTLLIGVVGSLAAFGLRFHRSAGIEREQMKWLVYAGCMMLVGFALSSATWFIWPEDPLVEELSIAMTNLTILGIAVAAAIAILRYRLYHIDLNINRTLVYGALTAGVAALYGLVVGGMGVALQTSSSLAALLLTGILAALVIRPLRGMVQQGVDRLMFNGGLSPQILPNSEEQAVERVRSVEKRTAQPDLSHDSLAGRRLALGRILWVLLTILAITLWAVGSVQFARDLPAACDAVACDPFELSSGDLAVAAGIHLPVGLLVGFWASANAAIALVFFAIAGLIAWRKSSNWMGLLVSFTLVYLGSVFFTSSDDALWRAHTAFRAPLMLLGMCGYAAFMLLLFHFPDGHFVPGSRYLQVTGWLVIILTAPLVSTATRVGALGAFPLLTMIGLGLAAQIYRYRRVSDAIQRQQTKWILLGLAASLLVMLIWVFTATNLPPDQPSIPRMYFLVLVYPLILILVSLLPVTIAFSILRYRLWDVDVYFNRALVYGTLTGVILTLYGLVVGVLGALFQSSGSLLVSLLATGLAAILFQPLRERLQRAVNRLMYGDRDDPYAFLSQLGARLESSLSPEATLPTVVETVAQALKLPYVAIELMQGEDYRIAASYGMAEEAAVRLPLVYQGEKIGRFILAARSPGESFTPSEERLLKDIAHHIGIAAHAVNLTNELRWMAADLQHSRERLVTAREEERRRLRRDLHDGLGPVLASQGLKLGVLLQQVRRDPEVSMALIEDLIDQNQGVLAEIRRLVYNLRPPALDELGLVEAIRDQVMLVDEDADIRPALQIRVEGPPGGLPALPAAIEVAAYRIALEAITNAARHAGADTCMVRIFVEDATPGMSLCLEVCDDGAGLPAGYRPGVGMASMKERAEEVGGCCEAETLQEGGTRVSARLPIFRRARGL